MMLDDPFLPTEQQPPSMEKVPSPLSAQILEFYESELFPETLQTLEVASTSNCCYQDHHHHHHQSSSYMNLSFPPSAPPPISIPIPIDDDINMTDNNSFSIIFEDDITADNDINLDFNHYPFGHDEEDQFDLTLLQLPLTTDDGSILPYPHPHPTDHVVPVMMGPSALPTSDQDHCCLSSMPPTSNNPSSSPPPPAANCSFINSINYSNPPPAALELETNCSFNVNNLFLGNIEIQPHQQGDIFSSTDPLPPPYNSNQLHQALSNESQHHLVNGNGNGSGSCSTATPSEMTSLEAETLRVTNKLTTEERKEKIHRYMKKRNQRNFSKKIKYACRKTLADSRPRVRGRFAKNDEFGENFNRTTCSNHEEDTDEDVKSIHVQVVKEEEGEDHLESSEMFTRMVNSLKYNYPAHPVLDLI